MSLIDKNDHIFIAGNNGMVGSAIVRNLKLNGFNNILSVSRKQLDLRDQNKTLNFFKYHKPDYVILAAAKVGGILANDFYRADFIYENIMIQSNIIHSAHLEDINKTLMKNLRKMSAETPVVKGWVVYRNIYSQPFIFFFIRLKKLITCFFC